MGITNVMSAGSEMPPGVASDSLMATLVISWLMSSKVLYRFPCQVCAVTRSRRRCIESVVMAA